MTVMPPDPPAIARRVAAAGRRLSRARFRQHGIGPRLPTRIRTICATPRTFVDWLEPRGALPPEDGSMRCARSLRRALRACRGAARARRSHCARRSTASARRSPPARRRPDASLELCRACTPLPVGAPRSPSTGDGCRWRWSVEDAPVEAALGPIALAAVKLFTEGDFSRIKRMRRPRLRLALLRHHQEQSPPMVRDGGLRQSRQAEAARGAKAQRMMRRLAVLLAAVLLAGCSPRSRPIRPGSAAWRCRR